MKPKTPRIAGATLLTSTTTVRRCTECRVRDRSKLRRIVVSLEAGDTIGLRLAGTRRTEYTTVDAVYSLAVKQRVAAELAERKRRKS